MNEIRLGSINGSHGVRGWVKLFSHTDPTEAILDYSPWILRKGDVQRETRIAEGQRNGKSIIARIDGIETRESADALIGYEIYVSPETLPTLAEGTWYWFQLEGLRVSNGKGLLLGQVDHLVETGANDVLVVRPVEGSVDDRERLIPYVEGGTVIRVDRDLGELVVDWEIDY